MRPVPVLEVGGTHVAAALVDPVAGTVSGRRRERLDSSGTLDEIMAGLTDMAGRMPVARPVPWGVAIPGPFHYDTGVGDFAGADKFHALEGVVVGAGLVARVPGIARCHFINAAAAFGLGEARYGPSHDAQRVFFLTLGTGLGSAFVDGGRIVDSGPRVPPRGWLFHATLDGRPLEEAFSRRALIRRYEERTGRSPDVGEIAAGVLDDADAVAVFDAAYADLTRGLTPWLEAFDPQAMVVGGSIARSWELIERLFVPRLVGVLPGLAVRPAVLGDDAPMLGAARWVADGAG